MAERSGREVGPCPPGRTPRLLSCRWRHRRTAVRRAEVVCGAGLERVCRCGSAPAAGALRGADSDPQSAAWWALTQDERRGVFEHSRRTSPSACATCRPSRGGCTARDLGPDEALRRPDLVRLCAAGRTGLDRLLDALRRSPKWAYVSARSTSGSSAEAGRGPVDSVGKGTGRRPLRRQWSRNVAPERDCLQVRTQHAICWSVASLANRSSQRLPVVRVRAAGRAPFAGGCGKVLGTWTLTGCKGRMGW